MRNKKKSKKTFEKQKNYMKNGKDQGKSSKEFKSENNEISENFASLGAFFDSEEKDEERKIIERPALQKEESQSGSDGADITLIKIQKEKVYYPKNSNLKDILVKEKCLSFDKNSIVELEDLGSGSFAKVTKVFHKEKKLMLALKSFNLSSSTKKEKLIESFFREKAMLEKIEKTNKSYFPKFFGSFYTENSQSEIESLIFLSEAGDCNLKELIQIRKQSQIRPYMPGEALGYLFSITKALFELMNLNIYHSDIKPSNIIYSASKKSIMIIDFGVSKIVKKDEGQPDHWAIDEYGSDGTARYLSPEKKIYFEAAKGKGLLPKKNKVFNPFRCDIYSLAVCIEEMFKDFYLNEKEKSQESILAQALENMKKRNWKIRFDAKKLDRFLCENSLEFNFPNESIFVKNLEKSKIDGIQFVCLIKKYFDVASNINISAKELDIYEPLKKSINESINNQNFSLDDDTLEKGAEFILKIKNSVELHCSQFSVLEIDDERK